MVEKLFTFLKKCLRILPVENSCISIQFYDFLHTNFNGFVGGVPVVRSITGFEPH